MVLLEMDIITVTKNPLLSVECRVKEVIERRQQQAAGDFFAEAIKGNGGTVRLIFLLYEVGESCQTELRI
jgi:hypothetical protein